MSEIDVQFKGIDVNFWALYSPEFKSKINFEPDEETKIKAQEEIKKDTDKIEDNMRRALELLRECEDLAKKHNQSFHWPGPSYGMGGWFHPEDVRKETNETYKEWYNTDEFGGWDSSNKGC